MLNKHGNEFVFKGKVYIKDIDAWVTRSSFLYDVLKAWCVINKNFHPRNCKIGKATFWNNAEVKINNKVILYKDWLEKGIATLNISLTTELITTTHLIK